MKLQNDLFLFFFEFEHLQFLDFRYFVEKSLLLLFKLQSTEFLLFFGLFLL